MSKLNYHQISINAKIDGTAQEALKAGTQEPSVFDQHHYRWLMHASNICNRRKRGGSDAPVVPFLDVWAFEFYKRHARLLRQQAGGAHGVIDPIILPFYRSQISGRSRRRGLECRTHAIHEQHTIADTNDDASSDTKSGDRGNVVGCKPGTADQCSKTNVEGLARHSEAARTTERRAYSSAGGPRQRAASSPFGLRELQAGYRRSADADCISGNQRGYRKTASGEDGGRSRGFSVDGSTSSSPLVPTGEVVSGYCAPQDQACGEDADKICTGNDSSNTRQCTSSSNTTVLSIIGVPSVFCPRTRSRGAYPHVQSGQSCYNNPLGESQAGRSKDRASDKQRTSRPVDAESATRRIQQRRKIGSEYASTPNEIDSSNRPAITLPRDDVEWDRVHTCNHKTCREHAEPCPAHPEDSLSLASLDGPSEAEVKGQQVERRVPQVPSGQVAARIRALELINAVPMPQHFQPAGHTRHAKVHRHHPHVDDEPTVELIFPLHVRRFPRRTITGSPCRPESPIHRSIPQGEPYIHCPQPARSMPMLRDPPEPEPQPETKSLETSRNNQQHPVICPDSARRMSENPSTRREGQP